MKPGAALAWLLVVPAFAACLGATTPPTRSPDALGPRTDVTVRNATGVEARDLACDPGRSCTEYFLIRIQGSENATLVKGPGMDRVACHKPWHYTLHRANQTLAYNRSRYLLEPSRVATIVADDFWGVTVGSRRLSEGCPTAYALHSFPASPFPNLTVRLGSYGPARITAYPNGFLVFGEGEYFVDLGKKVVVSYARLRHVDANTTYLVQGGFEVANLGPWPKDRITPAASGVVTRGPG